MSSAAWALDYRSIGPERAVLYDAPSIAAKKLYIVGPGYPVEVIVSLGDWLKVRDSRGELAWLEARGLVSKRTVLVMADQVEVREAADPAARVVFRVEKDVVLEFVEAGSGGWIKVRHRDGLTGYLQSTQVWGL